MSPTRPAAGSRTVSPTLNLSFVAVLVLDSDHGGVLVSATTVTLSG